MNLYIQDCETFIVLSLSIYNLQFIKFNFPQSVFVIYTWTLRIHYTWSIEYVSDHISFGLNRLTMQPVFNEL